MTGLLTQADIVGIEELYGRRSVGLTNRRAMIIIYTTIIYLAVLFGTGIVSFNM